MKKHIFYQESSTSDSNTDDDVYDFRFMLNRRQARSTRRITRERRISEFCDIVNPNNPPRVALPPAPNSTPDPNESDPPLVGPPSPTPEQIEHANKIAREITRNFDIVHATQTPELPSDPDIDTTGLTPTCSTPVLNGTYTVSPTPSPIPDLVRAVEDGTEELIIQATPEDRNFDEPPAPTNLGARKKSPQQKKKGQIKPKKKEKRGARTEGPPLVGVPQGSAISPIQFVHSSQTNTRKTKPTPKPNYHVKPSYYKTSHEIPPRFRPHNQKPTQPNTPAPSSSKPAHTPISLNIPEVQPRVTPNEAIYPSICRQLELVEHLFDVLDSEYTKPTFPPTKKDEVFPTIRLDHHNNIRSICPTLNAVFLSQPNNIFIKGINILEEGVQAYAKVWATRNLGRAAPCPIWNSAGCQLQGLHKFPEKPGSLLLHCCSKCWDKGMKRTLFPYYDFTHSATFCKHINK